MRIGKLFLTVFGILGVVKFLELFEVVRIEDVRRLILHLRGEDPDPMDPDYDPEYTLDEDILDELEDMTYAEREDVVEILSENMDEDIKQLDSQQLTQNVKQKPNVKFQVQKAKINQPKQTNKKVLDGRLGEVMKVFEKNDRVDTDILSKNVKGATVRTLRRDLEKLEKMKFVKKVGKTKGSYYVKL